jgi:hypothetical protein
MLIPYMVQKFLYIMCYWVNRCHHQQESIDDANEYEFTPIAAEAFVKPMAFETQEEETSNVRAPAKFKTGPKWKPFKEGCIAYFNSVHSQDQVPLAYII